MTYEQKAAEQAYAECLAAGIKGICKQSFVEGFNEGFEDAGQDHSAPSKVDACPHAPSFALGHTLGHQDWYGLDAAGANLPAYAKREGLQVG